MEQIIYFATGNTNKFREAKKILKGIDLRQVEIDLPEFQGSPEEVAEQKARIAFQQIDKPVFVDDTGLCFNALNGMPGIYIKHFLEAVGRKGLVRMLKGFDDKSAVAIALIGYCDGKVTKIFTGRCEGQIVNPKGDRFGWDPVFQPDGYSETFAEMKQEDKNKISHRRKALELLEKFLDSLSKG